MISYREHCKAENSGKFNLL